MCLIHEWNVLNSATAIFQDVLFTLRSEAYEDNIRVIKLNSVKYESPVVKVKSLAKK